MTVNASTVFNDQAAVVVQLASLPLEVAGLTLAFIEVRKPSVADAIEAGIDHAAGWCEQMIRRFAPRDGTGPLALAFMALVAMGFAIAAGRFLLWAGGYIWEREKPWWDPPVFDYVVSLVSYATIVPLFLLAVIASMWLALALALLSLRTISLVLRGLDRYAHGRALGAFGLILASMGLVGEMYQVLTIVVTWSRD